MFKVKKHLSKLQVFIFFITLSITNIYAVSINSLPTTKVTLQIGEVKNLFVVDGSVPHTWAICANAMRVGEYIGKNFKEIVNL